MKTFLLVIVVFSTHLYASDKPTEIKIITPSWPEVTEKNGSGIYFDILRGIYDAEHIQIKISFSPFQRALKSVEKQHSDVLYGVYSSDITKLPYLLTPKFHIHNETAVAIFKNGQFPQWRGLEQLQDQPAAIIRGYNYHDYLGTRLKAYKVNSLEQAFGMLNTGRVSVIIHEQIETEEFLSRRSIATQDIQIREVITLPTYSGFVNNKRGKTLIEIHDRRMQQLINNGELKAIYRKWQFPYPFD